jgi:hypothetical protein
MPNFWWNRPPWMMTAEDCRRWSVPLWWSGRPMNRTRMLTIIHNLASANARR